jgi:biopolymer transport protein ExbB
MPVTARGARTRLFTFFLACVVAFYLIGFAVPRLAVAQDAAPGDQPAQPKPTENPDSLGKMFFHIVKSVGLIMGLILGLLSLTLVFLIVLLIMDLRMNDAIPPNFVEDFTDTVNKRQFKQAFEMAKGDNSYLAKVLSTGMARLQYGIEDAREAAFNMVDSIKAGKEQLITYLATIGTLGPLLGLVGTVYSMIGAFMRMSDPTNPVKPYEMASTLSHGLVVTMLGIGLAVPAIFCHAFFRNRLIKISMETSNVADDLLTQMYHNSKKPAAAEPVAVAADARGSGNVKPAK